MQCVHASEKNPASAGELKIFNQIMETFSVNELAALTKKIGDARGLNVEIKNIPNPRREAESHYYNPSYDGLKELGVKPNLLTDESMGELFDIVEKNVANIRKDIIFKGITW